MLIRLRVMIKAPSCLSWSGLAAAGRAQAARGGCVAALRGSVTGVVAAVWMLAGAGRRVSATLHHQLIFCSRW
jgi:hypothetical protein